MVLPWEESGESIGSVSQDVQSSLIDCRRNVMNVTEIIVEAKVAEVIAAMGVCSCQKCISDIMAIALNSLPPKYVTTDVGKQFIQLNSYRKQFETDTVAALIKACQIVKDSPRHEK